MDFPATQPKPAADGKIIYYPPGVKEITDKITNDEVVKRLKVSHPDPSASPRSLLEGNVSSRERRAASGFLSWLKCPLLACRPSQQCCSRASP